MPTAAQLADAWDKKREITSEWLDSFIEDYPNLFTVVTVASANVALDLGAGLVDVLRLGQGTAEGGWGYGSDALRLLVFAGPALRALGTVRHVASTRQARLIVDPGGPICAWVAGTKVLRQLGQRHGGKLFVAVEDLAKASGQTMKSIGGIPNMAAWIATLRQVGAIVRPPQVVKTLGDIAKLTPNDGSVVMITVKVTKHSGDVVGHGLYAFRDAFRRLRFMDRTGVVRHLDDLKGRYGATSITPRSAAVVENVFGKIVNAAQPTAVLAMQVRVSPAVDPALANATSYAYRQGSTGLPRDATVHTVRPGDTLPLLAQKYYGDSTKWTLIYIGNPQLNGKDPNRPPPNATIWIPPVRH